MSTPQQMFQLMDDINAARKARVCERGHFHPTILPSTMFMGVVGLILSHDKNSFWPIADERNVLISIAAHLAQHVRSYLGEAIDGDTITDEELREILDEDSDFMISLLTRGIGLHPHMAGKPDHVEAH